MQANFGYKRQQQPLNKQSMPRGSRKFIFTNSSKVLPKHHNDNQFAQIIDNKKIYQTMIKDELRKLEALQYCVADPEVQPFQVPKQMNNTKINNTNNTKTQPKLNRVASPRHTGVSQKQIDFDQYLSKEMNEKSIKQVQKIVKKFEYYAFIKCLAQRKKYNNYKKAANYFNYERLIKSYFKKLKKLSIQQTSTNSNISIATQGLKLFILKKNMSVFKNSVFDFMLKDRIKVVKKTKQFRLKKQSLLYIYNIFSFQKRCQVNKNTLNKILKTKILHNILRDRSQFQKIHILYQNLIKNRRHRLIKNFLNNLKQFSSRNGQNLNDLAQQYYKTCLNKTFSQIEFKNFCIKNNLKVTQSRQLIIKFKIQKLKDKVLSQNQLNNQKLQFFNFIKQNKIINQSQKQLQQMIENNRKLQLFDKLKSSYQISKNYLNVQRNYLKFFMLNLIINSQNDKKFSNSLKNCLSGSKQWLIKNKHIFKAQPLNMSSLTPQQQQNPPNQMKQFHHPIMNETQIQLLKQNSKFKKCIPNYYMRKFVNLLKNNLKNKRKHQIAIFAIKTLRKQRLLKNVWEVFKNKPLINQIMNEINEQIQMQMSEQQSKKQKQTQNIIIKYSMIIFINKLKNNYQLKKNMKSFSQFFNKNQTKVSILKLKYNKQQQIKNKQLNQNVNKIIIKRKHKDMLKFIDQLRINNNNAKKIETINQLYNKQMKQNLQSKNNQIQPCSNYGMGIILIQRLKKRQLFQLLSINFILSKSSIQITKKYLSNRIQNMIKNYKEKQVDRQIRGKYQQLSNNIKKNKFIKLIQQMEKDKRFSDDKVNLVECLQKIKSANFIKSLFKFCIDKNNYNSYLKNVSILKSKLNKSRLTSGFQTLTKFYQLCKFKKQKNIQQSNKNVVKFGKSEQKLQKIQEFSTQINIPIKQTLKEKQIQQNSKIIQNHEISLNLNNEFEKYFQDNSSQQSNDLQKSPRKQIINIPYQQYQTSNDDQISYEQFRKSHLQIKDNQNNEISIQKQQQNLYDQLQLNNKSKNNKLNQKNNHNIQINGNQGLNYEKTQRRHDKTLVEENEGENQIDIQQSIITEEKQKQQISEEASEHFNPQYIQNKYNGNLIKRYFAFWKAFSQQNKEDQTSQGDYDLMAKSFQALKMYFKQKALTKRYLKQYQQELHYYPHSTEQYIHFKQIINQN